MVYPSITLRPYSLSGAKSAIKVLHHKEVVVFFAGTHQADLIELDWITENEQERARAFLRSSDKIAFLLGRTIVRCVLGLWIQQIPRDVPFGAARFHKPKLDMASVPNLDVSISHAGGWVACAFSSSGDVGIDLEPPRIEIAKDIQSLARSILTEAEYDGFHILTPSDKYALFFEIWRRKEAVLKAAGLGFGGHPKTFDVVDFMPGGTVNWRSKIDYFNQSWGLFSLSNTTCFDLALSIALNRDKHSVGENNIIQKEI